MEAYKKVCKHLESSNRTCVCHATGTGKSFIAAQYVRDYKNEKGLYVTSYKEIVNRFKSVLEFINAESDNLVFSTYQNIKKMNGNYDYIILDEFHRIGAQKWSKYANVIVNDNPNAKIIGLSATPVRYLDDERDMSDEFFENDVASTLSIEDVIKQNILPKPKYVPCIYSLENAIVEYSDKVKTIKDEKKRGEAEKLLKKAKDCIANSIGMEDVLKETLNSNGKYIVFCKDIEHLNSIRETMRRWTNGFYSYEEFTVISKDYKSHKNIKLFEEYNGPAMLFTINMLNEGTHIESIDGIIMMRKTDSWNVFVQQLGRALSTDTKEDNPLIFDVVNNATSFTNQKEFLYSINSDNLNNTDHKSSIKISNFEIVSRIMDFMDILSQIDKL